MVVFSYESYLTTKVDIKLSNRFTDCGNPNNLFLKWEAFYPTSFISYNTNITKKNETT